MIPFTMPQELAGFMEDTDERKCSGTEVILIEHNLDSNSGKVRGQPVYPEMYYCLTFQCPAGAAPNWLTNVVMPDSSATATMLLALIPENIEVNRCKATANGVERGVCC